MMQTISAINILRLSPVKIVPETNASLNVLEVPEANAFQEIILHDVDLYVTVRKDPITLAKNQAVTVVASNSTMVKSFIEFLSDSKLRTHCGNVKN
jgi:hypothetical protein